VEGSSLSDKPTYLIEKAFYRAERRAIETIRNAILSAGDPDQICVTLQGVLEDPTIRPYYNRMLIVMTLR